MCLCQNAWFKSHATYRTESWLVANNFWMHGAGVFHGFRLKSHAAFGADSRFTLSDFRIHWANVSDASLCGRLLQRRFGNRRCRCDSADLYHLTLWWLGGAGPGRQIFFGICVEALQTASAAKIIGLTF